MVCSGPDLSRNLFANHDWQKMTDVGVKRWAILKVDTIATSPTHRCYCWFYTRQGGFQLFRDGVLSMHSVLEIEHGVQGHAYI